MMEYIKGNRFDRDIGYMSDELFELFLGNADKYATAVLIGFFGKQMLHRKYKDFVPAVPRKKPCDFAYQWLNPIYNRLLTKDPGGTFKGTVYKATDAEVFIESSLKQAFEIAHISGKDVLYTETMEMVRSGAVISRLPATPNASARLAQDSVRRLLRFARRLVKN